MSRNPTTLTIVGPSGEKVVENIETWWYIGTDLLIEYQSGETDTFEKYCVID